MKHSDYARIEEPKDRKELNSVHEELFEKKDFVFRGHTKSEWKLKTSLDRFAEDIKEERRKSKLENFLLEEFQRRYHNYSPRAPETGSWIEWWALMQHYGTPTRLLDWTYSFYVAIFFALEDLNNNKESAVWAINFKWLKKKLDKKNKKLSLSLKKDKHLEDKKTFKKFNGKSYILRISPYVLHERLSVQQGCFLTPGKTKKSFIENLIEFSGSKKELKKHLFKIEIPKTVSIRRDILKDLYRMNISRASLFPGLDGFASSLKTIPFALPKLLDKK